MNTLKKGLSWSFIDNISQQIINFIIGIILARILGPEEFGLIAIVSIFVSLSNIFVNGGLSEALINNTKSDETDYNTIFWTNLLLSFFVYFVIILLSSQIDTIFDYNNLSTYINITAISIILMAISSIQRTKLTISLDFKSITIISLISVIISGLIAVYLAYNGYGVKSLVARMIIGQFITMILFWKISSWRPKLLFNIQSLRDNFSYSIYIFIPKLINSLFSNFYLFVIGSFFSPYILGIFSRADMFTKLFSTNISTVIQRVSFTYLSRLENNFDEQIKYFNKFFLITLYISSFFSLFLFFLNKEIVIILLGDKWIKVSSYLKILSLSIIFITMYSINMNFVSVLKHKKTYLNIELLSKIILTLGVIISIYNLSINFLLNYIVLSSIISYIVSLFFLKKINYKISHQFKHFLLVCIFFLLTYFLSYILYLYQVSDTLHAIIVLSSLISFFLFYGYYLLRDDLFLLKNKIL